MSREPAIPDNVSSPLRATWQGEHSRLRHAITNAKHKGKNAMKLVGFEANGKARLGFVEGEGVIDLSAADASLSADITEVLVRSGGDLGFLRDVAKKSKDRRPLKGLAYTLPVTNPGKIICRGLNYLEHAKEGGTRRRKRRRSLCAASPRSLRTSSRSFGQRRRLCSTTNASLRC